MRRVLLSVGLASMLASLALSGSAGAESRSAQASIRLTGVIEMRSNHGSTLTFFSRAQIDATLKVGADHVSVPMEYEWKGVRDSCNFAAAGTDGSISLRVLGVGNDGRANLLIWGSPPNVKSLDCNYTATPVWTVVGNHRVQSGVSQKITSTFNWLSSGADLPGTGTVVLTCPDCADAGSSETAKARPRVLFFRSPAWTPDGYKGGETVRFKERVAVLHNGVATGKVAGGRCEVFYTRGHTGALLKRLLVPGKWTPKVKVGSLTCSWKRPKGLFGMWEGVNPGVRYQGSWYHMSKKAYKGALFRRQLHR